jgi:hypothetical protein
LPYQRAIAKLSKFQLELISASVLLEAEPGLSLEIVYYFVATRW